MRADDLSDLVTIDAVRLHPDGQRSIVATSVARLEEDDYLRQLWLVDDRGVHPFTHGPRDTSPGSPELWSAP